MKTPAFSNVNYNIVDGMGQTLRGKGFQKWKAGCKYQEPEKSAQLPHLLFFKHILQHKRLHCPDDCERRNCGQTK